MGVSRCGDTHTDWKKRKAQCRSWHEAFMQPLPLPLHTHIRTQLSQLLRIPGSACPARRGCCAVQFPRGIAGQTHLRRLPQRRRADGLQQQPSWHVAGAGGGARCDAAFADSVLECRAVVRVWLRVAAGPHCHAYTHTCIQVLTQKHDGEAVCKRAKNHTLQQDQSRLVPSPCTHHDMTHADKSCCHPDDRTLTHSAQIHQQGMHFFPSGMYTRTPTYHCKGEGVEDGGGAWAQAICHLSCEHGPHCGAH